MPLSQYEKDALERLNQQFMKPEYRENVDILILETRCDGDVIVELADYETVSVDDNDIPIRDLIGEAATLDRDELREAAGADSANMVLKQLVPDGIDPEDVLSVERADDRVLARLSAPGYMDATDYGHYESLEEAQKCLVELYGDDGMLADPADEPAP